MVMPVFLVWVRMTMLLFVFLVGVTKLMVVFGVRMTMGVFVFMICMGMNRAALAVSGRIILCHNSAAVLVSSFRNVMLN